MVTAFPLFVLYHFTGFLFTFVNPAGAIEEIQERRYRSVRLGYRTGPGRLWPWVASPTTASRVRSRQTKPGWLPGPTNPDSPSEQILLAAVGRPVQARA